MNAHGTSRADRPSYRILLAEDNLINQNVARDVLIRWGHTVVTVDNGREALDVLGASADSSFDLVLMDVQMPEIDGLEATAAIRRRERETSGRHVPIVALTANVSAEVRRRCLDAGMDGFLEKPFDFDELKRVISNLPGAPADAGGARTASPAPVRGASKRPDRGEFDWPALVERIGDHALAQRIAEAFLEEDLPRLSSDLEHAIEAGDARGVAGAAHGLKGALGELGADSARAAATRLETLGSEGDLTEVHRLYEVLIGEIGRLTRSLEER